MKCYGQYHNNKVSCKCCEIKSYCEGAVYKVKHYTDLGKLDNYSEYALSPEDITLIAQYDDTSTIINISKLLSEIINNIYTKPDIIFKLLTVFKTLYKNSKIRSRIVSNKILNPYKSYSMIGAEENITKQNVDYHIKKAMKEFPILKQCLLIDTRFYSAEQKKKSKNTIVEKC